MSFLSLPLRGLLRVFEEVAQRAEDEMYNEDAVMAELTELYRKLETGVLNEEEFNERESELVLRLEAIEEHKHGRRAH